MIAEHQNLAADGVDLVELRLDFLRRDPDLGRLIPQRPTAVVVTVRRRSDGGLWRESEDQRLKLLRTAIAEGPEFVDLEVDIADEIPRFGAARRIISFHDPDGMPNDLEALHRKMLTKDPDVIKIAVNPKTITDMFGFIRFVRDKNREAKRIGDRLSGDPKSARGVRVVGICMGEMGKASRILAKKFEMPYTYATFSSSRIVAPGLLVYKDMLDLYHYEQTNAETRVFGIIGNPIGHSLSPLIHNRSFVEQKINAVYVPFTLDEENVDEFMRLAPDLDIKGVSVTIPHKVAVMKGLTKMDPAVGKIGACNTVVFRDEQRLGYNTDYKAAVSSIEFAMGGDLNDEVGVLEGKTALVLGAGGAGMALAYGLKKRGAMVTITDINGNRAYQVAKDLDVEVFDWVGRYNMKPKPEVIANCTPIGMHPKVDESPYDRANLNPHMVVFDAVYNPENTLLIKTAREKGCTVVPGIEMFVGQACLQFRLFTGQKASASFIRRQLKSAISAVND